MPDSIADLADAGAELRNSFSHPLTQTALTLGMAVPMLENTHRLVALLMNEAAVRDAAWRNADLARVVTRAHAAIRGGEMGG